MKFRPLATSVVLAAGLLRTMAFDASSFAPHVDFPADSLQTTVDLGDLDGDGKPDAVVANYYNASVSVYRNISTTGTVDVSSFAPRVNFAVGNTPMHVLLADLDGDGKLDIICVNENGSAVSLLRNTATAGAINSSSFAPKVDLATANDPRAVALADLNGDGKRDVIVSCYGSGALSVFQNNSTAGTFSFGARVDIGFDAASGHVDAGDVDGDGNADIVVSSANTAAIWIYRNLSNSALTAESFAARVTFASGNGASATLADIDGDGKPDIVAPNASDNTLSVWRNTTSTPGTIGASSFTERVNFPAAAYPHRVSIADMDADGRVDIVLPNADSHSVSVFRNLFTAGSLTNTSFAPRIDYPTGTSPRTSAIADIDGDGLLDIANANVGLTSFSVLRQTGTNAPPPPPPIVYEDFDLSRDFDSASSPSGAWSYGWKSTLDGAFSVLTQRGTASTDNSVLIAYWAHPVHGQPTVYANTTASTGTGAGGFVAPPHCVWLIPGLNGRSENFTVVRFTAPSNSNYEVNGSVAPMYTGWLAGDYDFHVVRNGVELFGQFLGAHSGTTFSNVVELESGGTLDFVVGRGADESEYGSSARVAALITPTTNAVTVFTNPPPPPPPVPYDGFDLSRDFDPINNPAGVWSYGWKGTLSGAFSVLTKRGPASTDNGVPITYWAHPVYGQPTVYANMTASTGLGAGGFVAPPGCVFLIPGLNGRPENFSTIRFSAPSNGNYEVSAAVAPMYTGSLAGNTDFHVVQNGTELFGIFLGAHDTTAFTNIIALTAGDTLDFAVGRGADENEYGSTVRLAASIIPTTNAPTVTTNPPPPPPPPGNVYADFDLARDFDSANNPSTAWSYGWEGALGGTFNTLSARSAATTDNGVPCIIWALPVYGQPAVYANMTGGPGYGAGGFVAPPGSVWLVPGRNGRPENFSVIRFTSPSNSYYEVGAAVAAMYTGSLAGDTDFHILRNGTQLFGQFLDANEGTAFTNVIALDTGDTLDFVVGRGADGNEYGSTVRVGALITPTTNAPTVVTNPPLVAPTIVVQPVPYQSVVIGGSAQLSIVAVGTDPRTFQWFFNDAPLAGADAAALALGNVQSSNSGPYYAVVSNEIGSVTSIVAVINVIDAPTNTSGGTLLFANNSTNRIYDVGGSNFVASGSSLVVGLFAGQTADNMQQIGALAQFNASFLPGRFSGGMRSVPGTSAGQTVSVQVKVWDSASGTNYDQAVAGGGKSGASSVFQVTLGGGLTPPPSLTAMPAFALTMPGSFAPIVKALALPSAPVTLRRLARTGDGWTLALTGPASATCAIEVSSDLITWTTIAYIVNESGIVEYKDNDTSTGARYYRARLVNP